jgi:general secretion pathway protein C
MNIALSTGRRVAGFAAALLCGWQIGLLALRLVAVTPAPEQRTMDMAELSVDAPTQNSRMYSTRLPLFGDEPATVSAPVAEPARNTTDYRLQGLLVMADGDGWAVIDAGSEIGLFRTGDTLPGGETISAVEPAGVVITGPQGRIRILLDDDATRGGNPASRPAAGTAPAEPSAAARPPPPQPSAAALQRARELLESLRVQRVRVASGEVGLRIAWISDDPAVAATGLRRGDIIMAVNGHSVEDPDAYAAVLTEAEDTGVLSIDVLRGATRTSLTVEVTDG